MPTAPSAAVPGPVLFARYAFPPNHHGYCGPADHLAFFESGTGGDDRGLRAMAREFAGAWPYLELIAGATGLSDPLDPRAVEAYWIGSPRLDRVGVTKIGSSMEDRFRFRSGPRFGNLTAGVLAGGVPHHSFAVFCIYPWTGLLGDDRRAGQALTVLDMCRIRWGRVVHLHGDRVAVESRHLTWDGRRLGFGEPELETVERAIGGLGLSSPLRAGDWVAMHWEWVCDRVTERQVRALRHYTRRHLDIVNAAAEAGPAGMLA
ncbi:DUF6390 family protein [Georgenia sp. SYP-B2076]|uniref:DUF6390 family protein n=1 Tax=Georgenia sp. SYP-B2076 TaxID=2495881 RepID=UPI000F8F6411|nr:DUF6390 family protein [Georgenia sp. SYP-B2076]